MLKIGKTLLGGLADLFYPKCCFGCDRVLDGWQEVPLCLPCTEALPLTNFHEIPENPITDRFAGRLRLKFGGAMLHYRTGSVTQQMIAGLKYHNRPEIAEGLGRLYGSLLSGHEQLDDLAGIVPVPLHPKRRFERGYNQAERFGAGLSEKLSVPLLSDALVRKVFEGSQTKQGAEGRFANVANNFQTGRRKLDDQHLLLVDDVLTTGATLEACAEAILSVYPEVTISLATIALRE